MVAVLADEPEEDADEGEGEGDADGATYDDGEVGFLGRFGFVRGRS